MGQLENMDVSSTARKAHAQKNQEKAGGIPGTCER
jgi:hypothetical protein